MKEYRIYDRDDREELVETRGNGAVGVLASKMSYEDFWRSWIEPGMILEQAPGRCAFRCITEEEVAMIMFSARVEMAPLPPPGRGPYGNTGPTGRWKPKRS